MAEIRDPVEVMGECAKEGIDGLKEGAIDLQKKVREGRTSEDNFRYNVLSGFVGVIGCLLLISGYTAFGFIILILAYIISVLPGKKDR